MGDFEAGPFGSPVLDELGAWGVRHVVPLLEVLTEGGLIGSGVEPVDADQDRIVAVLRLNPGGGYDDHRAEGAVRDRLGGRSDQKAGETPRPRRPSTSIVADALRSISTPSGFPSRWSTSRSRGVGLGELRPYLVDEL